MLSNSISKLRNHPVEFVRQILKVEPDKWQVDALEALKQSARVAMSIITAPSASDAFSYIFPRNSGSP